MEASKITFFKETENGIQKGLSRNEKRKLRFDRIKKMCPDSGVPLREFLKIAGFDPGIDKQYKAGSSFVYKAEKDGEIIKIPGFSNGHRAFLYAPNFKKVVTTKTFDVVKPKEEIQVEKVLEDVNVHLNVGENKLTLNFKNVKPSYLKKAINDFLENL